MAAPLFSVVIPTYNRARLLRRAVKSVLAQTCADFELLVVDDASTDETGAVLAAFGDERVTHVRREQNGGHAAARNTGIARAEGEYIAFLDDDDEYLPRFLEEMRRAFEGTGEDIGFGWCGVRWVQQEENAAASGDCEPGSGREAGSGRETVVKEELWQPSYKSREHAYVSFLKHRRIGTGHGFTVRRSCFETVGLFDDTLEVTIDTEFLVRLVREFGFTVAPRVLVKIHIHPGERQSERLGEKARTYERIIEKHAATLHARADVAASLHYKTGWLHYHAGQKAQARPHLAQTLRRKPLQPKAWAVLLLFELLPPARAARLHRRLSAGASQLRGALPE